jgi:hypothetical protein
MKAVTTGDRKLHNRVTQHIYNAQLLFQINNSFLLLVLSLSLFLLAL